MHPILAVVVLIVVVPVWLWLLRTIWRWGRDDEWSPMRRHEAMRRRLGPPRSAP